MTRRHFIEAANIIRAITSMTDRQEAAYAFADMFRRANPRFDRARFLAACGC